MDEKRFVLEEQNGVPCVRAGGKTFRLSCHPFEPCLYITDESGVMTIVCNAFDPRTAMEAFQEGRSLFSITGKEYTEADFCRMVVFAAGRGEITIDEAEKVFVERDQKSKPEASAEPKEKSGVFAAPEGVQVIEEDPFFEAVRQYPDSVVDFCLIKSSLPYDGVNSHWAALTRGALRLIAEDGDLAFKPGSVKAKRISAEALFAPTGEVGESLNYRTAFLCPPYPNGYTDKDFETLNDALFPKGRDRLEVYEWTTNWSDYFDEGHEWWGALCLTVYDKNADRFVVILASATD